jgi:hypothetical protein
MMTGKPGNGAPAVNEDTELEPAFWEDTVALLRVWPILQAHISSNKVRDQVVRCLYENISRVGIEAATRDAKDLKALIAHLRKQQRAIKQAMNQIIEGPCYPLPMDNESPIGLSLDVMHAHLSQLRDLEQCLTEQAPIKRERLTAISKRRGVVIRDTLSLLNSCLLKAYPHDRSRARLIHKILHAWNPQLAPESEASLRIRLPHLPAPKKRPLQHSSPL